MQLFVHEDGSTPLQNRSQLSQGDHSPDTLKFPDISLTMCGPHAHVKWYS